MTANTNRGPHPELRRLWPAVQTRPGSELGLHAGRCRLLHVVGEELCELLQGPGDVGRLVV